MKAKHVRMSNELADKVSEVAKQQNKSENRLLVEVIEHCLDCPLNLLPLNTSGKCKLRIFADCQPKIG